MSRVHEILSAIEKLPPGGFLKLQARLERLSEQLWQQEHQRLSRRFRQAGRSDDDIDRFVLRRRLRR